jgi:thymidylate synthase ThyX
MKIIEPSVEIITETNPLKRIELCGRVCYKSEKRITEDSAVEFVERAVSKGHTSILEHARVRIGKNALLYLEDKPYGYEDRRNTWLDCDTMNCRDIWETSALTVRELGELLNANDYVTARLITDRGVLAQLTRHRIMSFSAESTKFIKYNDGITVVRPIPFSWANSYELPYYLWEDACRSAEKYYMNMVLAGCSAQEARSVLPQSTKTELIMTGTYDAWDTVFALRTPKGVQPQTRYMMKLLLDSGAFENAKDKYYENMKDMWEENK